jgi:hypothetical protein
MEMVHRQSGDEPKKKHTAAAIVHDMNKVMTMSTFPILEYNADTPSVVCVAIYSMLAYFTVIC